MTDNTVYLLVGPQGAGKTEHSKKLVARDSTLFVIRRDDILVEMFGSVHQSPYTGAHYAAEQVMYEKQGTAC